MSTLSKDSRVDNLLGITLVAVGGSVGYRRRCAAIRVLPVRAFCIPETGRWAFKATVLRSRACKGFVGYGDADPSNVSSLVHGAEMRVAETRAVNRALRQAYGRHNPPESRRSSRRSLSTETTAARRFETAFARLFGSISSIPSWSRPTPPTSAASKRFAMPPANR